MLNAKTLYLSIFSLMILLAISTYFTTKTWSEYNKNSTLQNMFENVQTLQSYEDAILDEVLCTYLIPNDKSENAKLCESRIKETQDILNIIESKEDILLEWASQTTSMKDMMLKHGVHDLESLLPLDNVHSPISAYLNKVALNTNSIEKKELLSIYTSLSNSYYATSLENFLVTYYSTKKEVVSTSNIIFWDKIVDVSSILDLSEAKYIFDVQEDLKKSIDSDAFQKALRKIDDMRIAILTGNMHKSSNPIEWIKLLESKEASLKEMKTIIINKLNEDIASESKTAFSMLLVYLSILIMSIVTLGYLYVNHRQVKKEEEAFLTTVNRISALSSYDMVESEVMHEMLNKAKNKEDIYAYIYSSYQLLHEKQKQAQDEADVKGKFLSTLSHEIRTPLSAIIGFSKLLKDLGSTSEQEEFLSLIEGSSKNLISIVNDILDLSKLNAEKMELENISFSLFEVVESTVNTFSHKTNQKDIELSVFIDPFLSYYFMGDSTKLSQILTNLIGNAVKFTEEYGKINIFVQGMKDKDDSIAIKFAVNDNGVGLSPEQIETVFNPFSQANESTSNQFGGTGLGLAISRDMVELMGGQLEVSSTEQNGTTFYFTLELAIDKAHTFKPYPHFPNIKVGLGLPSKSIDRQLDSNLETYIRHLGAEFKIYYYEDLFSSDKIVDLPDIMIIDHHYARLAGELEQCASLDCKTVLLTNGTLRSRINPERHTFNNLLYMPVTLRKSINILQTSDNGRKTPLEKSTVLANVESFTGLNVLAVDDNVINRKLIKIILEKIGLNVTLASDGHEAVQKYKANQFNIIFMDIQMPHMDGVDATHSIIEYEKEKDLLHVPIIALTANVATGDKELYMSEGMDDYATKPLEIDVIKAMITKHCGAY